MESIYLPPTLFFFYCTCDSLDGANSTLIGKHYEHYFLLLSEIHGPPIQKQFLCYQEQLFTVSLVYAWKTTGNIKYLSVNSVSQSDFLCFANNTNVNKIIPSQPNREIWRFMSNGNVTRKTKWNHHLILLLQIKICWEVAKRVFANSYKNAFHCQFGRHIHLGRE